MSEIKLFSNEDTYKDIIIKYANKYGVPAELCFSIFAVESQFNQNWIRYESHLNDSSYGIGQILYTTAKGLGYVTNTNDIEARKGNTKEALLNPEINIMYSVKFISNLYKQYNKKISDVISAYNAGSPKSPANTAKSVLEYYSTSDWLRFVGYKPITQWIYGNQPYVDRVLAYLTYYHYKFIEPNIEKLKSIMEDIRNNLHTSIFEKYLSIDNAKIVSKLSTILIFIGFGVFFLIK